MRNDGLENETLTGHTEDKIRRERKNKTASSRIKYYTRTICSIADFGQHPHHLSRQNQNLEACDRFA